MVGWLCHRDSVRPPGHCIRSRCAIAFSLLAPQRCCYAARMTRCSATH